MLGRRLGTAVAPLRQGKDLETSLKRTGALTGVVQDMVSTGQMTGNVDEMLDKVAEYYEAEAEVGLQKSAIIIGIVTLLIVAVVVLLIAVSYYGQYFGGLQRQGSE